MTRAAATISLAALFVSACAGDEQPAQRGSARIATTTLTSTDPSVSTPPSSPTASSSASSTPDLPESTTTAPPDGPATADSTPEPSVGDPRVGTQEVDRFDAPVGLAVRVGDQALYIVEQPGRVVQLHDQARNVVADITDRTRANGERGLLGLAFALDGRLAYLHYNDLDGDTVVAEYPVTGDGRIDVAAERIVLTLDQPYSNHNGGDVTIAPDGTLLIALGDGGSGGDPQRRASDPTSLLGSLLRIDPRPDGDLPYTVPPDNPFAAGQFDGTAGAPEVWAWGLRNPWKIDIDPLTGDLWIADVGQNAIEEINLVSATPAGISGRGANFGWSGFEGTDRFNTDVPDPGNAIPPVLTYRHGDDGCSISGGVVYRGTAIPELAPAYVYSDYCSGTVWALDLAGGRNLVLLDDFDRVSAVRRGPDGELYVLELGGTLHRIVAA